MIKIDVLIKAAEFLENSERSLIKLHDESSLSLSPSSPPSPQNSIKKESKDKFLSKSEKAIHNTLEKNRRAHLKKCFESLQKELPLLKDKKKATNLAILNYTLKFIQQSQKKDKENENEIVKLMQKQELLKNAQKKILCEIERESPSFKSLVYEQISTQTNYANLQENIEKAKIDIESSVKVKSPIIESSNENETICGETGNNFEGSPTIQNIENRIENGRSFYNEDSDDQLTKLKSLTTSSSSTPLVDQIKNFGNIRIDLESLSKKGILALSTLGEANFARFNKMQLLTLSSQLVENS